MPTQVQFRRGTTAQNNSFTGAIGEISINTSNNTIRVHDSSTAGGFELAKRGNVSTLTSGTSAELAAVISDETGSGALVFATSPTLVTPALGTPSAIVLTSGTGLPISTGVSGLGTGIATALAINTGSAGAPVLLNGALGTPSSGTLTNATGLPLSTGVTGTLPVANGGTGVTTSTGSGNVVLSTSPVLTTPALGTPSAIVLTSGTGLPLTTGVTGTLPVANGGTGITSLGSGIATFLGTPSSSNLASAVTDETGSGALVFATSPTLVTPALGTPSSGTLTNATGLPLSTGVTGTLPVANGGTGTATPATVAGTGISVSGSFPNQTITNTGVTSLVAGTNISVSGATGAVTVSVTGTVSAATNATNTAITDDTSTNSTHFPTFVSASSGNAGQKTSSSKLTFNPSSGLLTSTDYNSSSDKRLKKNIKTVSNAVETINALRGVTFEWKEGGIKSAGLIAQEVEKVLPDSVSIDDNGFMGIRYNNLIGILVEAVKEQQNQINSLKQQIEKLNG